MKHCGLPLPPKVNVGIGFTDPSAGQVCGTELLGSSLLFGPIPLAPFPSSHLWQLLQPLGFSSSLWSPYSPFQTHSSILLSH